VAEQTRRLCIVSRDRLDGRDFLAAVQASVQPEDYLEVIVDRRRSEPSTQWRGADDRRKRPHVDLALQESGVAIVPAASPADERRREPAPREQGSGQRFEDRLVGREIPQDDWPVWAERDPFSARASSRFASPVTTTPDDYRPELYENRLDDDAEQFEAIRSFKSERPRRRRSLPPWIIAGLVVAAAVIVLSLLAHSLKQTLTQSIETLKQSIETLKQSAPPRASSEAPRATDPSAGGEPSSVPSRDDTSAASHRDSRERSAENSAQVVPPQAATGTTGRARSSVNEPSAERSSAQVAPPTAPGATAGRRTRASETEPEPRRSVAALPPPSEPVTRMTSPRFPDLPRVDVSREAGANGIYSARIVDPAGRPIADADVLLLARMSDGTVENIMMHFYPDRGIYRGALPTTRASIVYLRLRVITGDKRLEIPVEP
jgi:hypothetical protein